MPTSDGQQNVQDAFFDKLYAQYYNASIWSADKLAELQSLLSALPVYNPKALNAIPLVKGKARVSSE